MTKLTIKVNLTHYRLTNRLNQKAIDISGKVGDLAGLAVGLFAAVETAKLTNDIILKFLAGTGVAMYGFLVSSKLISEISYFTANKFLRNKMKSDINAWRKSELGQHYEPL